MFQPDFAVELGPTGKAAWKWHYLQPEQGAQVFYLADPFAAGSITGAETTDMTLLEMRHFARPPLFGGRVFCPLLAALAAPPIKKKSKNIKD